MTGLSGIVTVPNTGATGIDRDGFAGVETPLTLKNDGTKELEGLPPGNPGATSPTDGGGRTSAPGNAGAVGGDTVVRGIGSSAGGTEAVSPVGAEEVLSTAGAQETEGAVGTEPTVGVNISLLDSPVWTH